MAAKTGGITTSESVVPPLKAGGQGMGAELTTAELIRHFTERVESIDRDSWGAVHGKEPNFPMLVLFLGEESMREYEHVSRNLLQVWPQFKEELQFMGVRSPSETPEFVRLAQGQQVPMTTEEAEFVLDMLADARNHFRDHTRQLLYYVLDSASMRSDEDLHAWTRTIEVVKRELGAYEDDVMQMLFVLLDEGMRKRAQAARIRNAMSEYCAGGPRERYRVFLLSNRLSGNKLMPDWDSCYRICTSLMALSNNDDTNIADILFDKGVATVSYFHDEKPVDAIGQVVVMALVDYLSSDDEISYVLDFAGVELQHRLGFDEGGTLALIDEYVDKTLVPMLPDPAQINLFPRWTAEDYGDISVFTADELDDLTMGTWNAVLEEIVRGILERIRTDGVLRNRWSEDYRRMLGEEFKVGELVSLALHSDDIRKMFLEVREPSARGSALDYAKRKMRTLLSSTPDVVDLFTSAINTQAQYSNEFREVWKELCRSTLELHEVHDRNLVEYYQGKVRSFLDRRGLELRRSFRDIASLDMLRTYLFDAIDDVIESDPVFTASYEEEQESRLSRDAHAQSAQQYIRQRLTGDNVRTYLQVNFSLDSIPFKSVLLKAGTKLSHNLRHDLSPSTYYYDTGYGNAVEVLNVRDVMPQNLLATQGR